MSLPRPWYRTRQFLQALRPQLSVQERQEVATFLRNDLFALFQSMTLRDQRHSLDVYNFLRAQGNDDRELLTAALLHDVGKGGRVQLWERVTYVLLAGALPSLLRRTGGGLARLRDHAAQGATLVANAGGPPQVASLVLKHEDARKGVEDRRLAALMAADDAC